MIHINTIERVNKLDIINSKRLTTCKDVRTWLMEYFPFTACATSFFYVNCVLNHFSNTWFTKGVDLKTSYFSIEENCSMAS